MAAPTALPQRPTTGTTEDRPAFVVGDVPLPPPPPPPPPADPCVDVRANLAATQGALLDATDRIEEARVLCRDQIVRWRAEKPPRSWAWIKKQPASEAFYGPLEGS